MKIAQAQVMREMDRFAIETLGVPSDCLMENAARAVAETVLQMLEGNRNAAVFCGSGNNGGDGVAAARLLLESGCAVRCFLCGRREKLTADTALMERRLEAAGGSLEQFDADEAEEWLSGCAVAVDALYGTGLNADLRGDGLTAVRLMNASGAMVVSCDIASGVDCNTGRILGDAVRADVTVTFSMAKPGQLLPPGADCTGRLEIVDIGIPEEAQDRAEAVGVLIGEESVRSWLPVRRRTAHKGDFGKLLLVCGSTGFTGAAALAARAALRSGAGLVFLGVPEKIYPILAAKLDEAIVFPLPDDGTGKLSLEALPELQRRMETCDACLIGPGLGRSDELDTLVRQLVGGAEIPVVVDADGINAVAGHMDVLRGRQAVLTPHDGEFARLGGRLPEDGRFGAAMAMARDTGAVVLLKGYRTVVTDGETLLVNTSGNPGMATGGSGDVLAGILTALLGQGLTPLQAAAAAAWLHGAAGDLAADELGEYGMLPTDLLERLPRLLP